MLIKFSDSCNNKQPLLFNESNNDKKCSQTRQHRTALHCDNNDEQHIMKASTFTADLPHLVTFDARDWSLEQQQKKLEQYSQKLSMREDLSYATVDFVWDKQYGVFFRASTSTGRKNANYSVCVLPEHALQFAVST